VTAWAHIRGRLTVLPIRSMIVPVATVGMLLGAWSIHGPVWTALRRHPYFQVTEVVIRGAGPLLSPRDVREWLGEPDTLSVWDASPVRLRKRLESHPLIGRALVRRDFPNRLEIDVHERRPEAIALLDRLYYIDRSGRLLTPLTAEHERDYPVITGLMEDAAPGYRTWAFRRAMRLLRLCERMACAVGVSEVHLDRDNGVELYPVSPKVALILGWGSWREKLTRTSRVLESWDGYADRLASVDARYRNQVVIKMRSPGANGARPRDGEKVGI